MQKLLAQLTEGAGYRPVRLQRGAAMRARSGRTEQAVEQ
jgi:hypothetical protein